jgi:hypothetical protein
MVAVKTVTGQVGCEPLVSCSVAVQPVIGAVAGWCVIECSCDVLCNFWLRSGSVCCTVIVSKFSANPGISTQIRMQDVLVRKEQRNNVYQSHIATVHKLSLLILT